MPKRVGRRHFWRSIQSRFRYQSSSLGAGSLSVTSRPRRSSIFFVLRTTTERTYQPPESGSCGDLVLVDQPAQQISTVKINRRRGSRSLADVVGRCESESSVRPVPVVVLDVDAKDTLEVAAAEDQQVV